jgi:hypothetical protein
MCFSLTDDYIDENAACCLTGSPLGSASLLSQD